MPKNLPLDLVVPGTPTQVADALKDHTFFRPFPTGGAGPIRLSKKPLGGRVGADGFNVSLYQPSFINMTQPVARAKLTETPGGTRVQGTVGLHPWVTTYLRLAYVAITLGGVAAGVGAVVAGGVAASVVAVLAFLLMTTVAIGANVAHADDRVDALLHQLQATLKSGAAIEARPLGDADPDALRAAEAEVADLETPRPDARQPDGS